MRRTVTLVLLAASMLVAGCATETRSNVLNTTLIGYANALRWDGFAAAMQFVDPKWRAGHPLSSLDQARYDQVRVASYDEGNGPVPTGPDQVGQVVTIGLINKNTLTARTIVDRQTWTWDAAAKRWWLSSGPPDITRQP